MEIEINFSLFEIQSLCVNFDMSISVNRTFTFSERRAEDKTDARFTYTTLPDDWKLSFGLRIDKIMSQNGNPMPISVLHVTYGNVQNNHILFTLIYSSRNLKV